MPTKANRPCNHLVDRPEYRSMQHSLTCSPDTSVGDAAAKMSSMRLSTDVDFIWSSNLVRYNLVLLQKAIE